MKGYEAYAGAAGALRRMGATGFLEGFLDATAHGTPEQVIEKYRDPVGAARPLRGRAGVPLRRPHPRRPRPACACSPPRSSPS